MTATTTTFTRPQRPLLSFVNLALATGAVALSIVAVVSDDVARIDSDRAPVVRTQPDAPPAAHRSPGIVGELDACGRPAVGEIARC